LSSLVVNHPLYPPGIFVNFPPLARLQATLEAELGPAAWTAAWEHGKALDMDSAFAQEASTSDA